jgi:hypothetical protein
VAATLTASAHVGQFAKSGSCVWPIWDNSTSAITIAGEWVLGGNLSTYTSACTAPSSGAALEIVTASADMTSGILDPGAIAKWRISGVQLSTSQAFLGANATLAGVRFSGTTQHVVRSGFVQIFGSVAATSGSGAAALIVRGAALVSMDGCMVVGGPSTVIVDSNASLSLRASTIRQTLGAAGVASLSITNGGKVNNPSAPSWAGNDIQNPVTGVTYAVVATYGGGTVGLTDTDTRLGTTSVDAASFAFLQ